MMAVCVDCIDTWTLVGGFHGGLWKSTREGFGHTAGVGRTVLYSSSGVALGVSWMMAWSPVIREVAPT